MTLQKKSKTFLEQAEIIPRVILQLSGVRKLIFEENNDEISDGENTTASAIFSQARALQAEASTFRFGKTVRTIGGPSANTSTYSQKNILKAGQIQAERRQKREEAKHLDTNIQIVATLWQLKQEKLTLVSYNFILQPSLV